MPAQHVEENAILSVEDLRSIAECSGPCISLYLPVTSSGIERTRWKAAMQQVENKLAERKAGHAEVGELLEPLRNFDISSPGSGTVAIFCAKDLFRTYQIPWTADDLISVAGHFQVAPLLPLLQRPKQFFILALSQKHVRLLRCTADTSEEVDLPASLPRSISEGIDEADQGVEQRSGGSTLGSVGFGSGSGSERREERLAHFYKDVDRELVAFLKNDPTPLVIAGVDYELALYRRISHHPHICEEGVHGAADGLKGGELHRRALEIVMKQQGDAQDSALALYEKQGGTDKTSTDGANILKAAREGRVAHLFLAAGSEPAESHNAAAVQTLLHSGRVHVAPHIKMPEGSVMAALFRY